MPTFQYLEGGATEAQMTRIYKKEEYTIIKKRIYVAFLLILYITFNHPLDISAQTEDGETIKEVCDEGIPASSKAAFYEEYNRLPEYLKDVVSGSGVTVYLDSGREHTGIYTGLFTAWIPEGGYAYDYTIHIDSSKTYNVSFATLHEIGHLADFILGETSGNMGIYYSSVSEFSQIYQTEAASSGLGKYAASSPSEYFAEAFKIYFQDPGRLQEDAPLTFQYVENICILLSDTTLEPAV